MPKVANVDAQVRRRMANTRSRDTAPEIAVRRELHRLGFRYRVNYQPVENLRRTADIVFTKPMIAIFIDGCFWHRCPEHYRPATGQRAAFWREKIESNAARDTQTTELLTARGWIVKRFWEHEPPTDVAREIADLLRIL